MKLSLPFLIIASLSTILFGTPASGVEKRELLPTMIWRGSIPLIKEGNGLFLQSGKTEAPRLETTEEFTPPFKVTIRVITDVTETRIQYSKGAFMLNWGDKPDEVRVHDLSTGEAAALPGKGLKPGKEHTIVLEVGAKRVVLKAGGQQIYSGSGDYQALKDKLAIGPAMGSKIHVLSFAIEK